MYAKSSAVVQSIPDYNMRTHAHIPTPSMCRRSINSPNITINERAGNSYTVMVLDRSTAIRVANRAKRTTDAAQQVLACMQ
ncbi:MAG TPA: hypothetical protein VNI77_04660 [Nitrososphaera sp.]|nr:hypothetical protein [Nitrososphaera sp.]